MASTTIDGADIRLPAVILGVGLGGFVDGIVLHQVLQWPHMLSSTGSDNVGIRAYPVDTVSGLQMNTLWDGLFHVVTWVAVLTGLALLYSRVTRSRGRLWRSGMLWGWALVGWGLFNLVEGVIDHHLLGIHHVHGARTRPPGHRLPAARGGAGGPRLGDPAPSAAVDTCAERR